MATLGGVVAVGADRKLPPASEFRLHYRELGVACQMHYRPRELRRITRLLTIPPFEERPQLGTAVVVVSNDLVREAERLGGEELGTERAGLDNGHEESKGRDFLRQRLRKAFEGELACAVERRQLCAEDAAKLRNVEDASVASGTHDGQDRPRNIEDTKQIRGELGLRVADRRLFEESQMAVSCVVDQHINCAKPRYGQIDRSPRLIGDGNVELNRQKLVAVRPETVNDGPSLAARGDHTISSTDRCSCDLCTKPAAGAGNEPRFLHRWLRQNRGFIEA